MLFKFSAMLSDKRLIDRYFTVPGTFVHMLANGGKMATRRKVLSMLRLEIPLDRLTNFGSIVNGMA